MESNIPNKKKFFIQVIFVIIVASIGSYILIKTGPKTQPEDKKRPPKIVKTQSIKPDNQPIVVTAYGSVVPAQRVVIEPEVQGVIISMHPSLIRGGRVAKGDKLFSIDPTLTELTLREDRAALTRAQAVLNEAQRKLVEGTELSSEQIIPDTELAALKANIEVSQADLLRLQASVERTEELLDRHELDAPFNGLILNESIDLGQRVSSGFNALTLVGTDSFHISASLPVDKLKWIRLPRNGEAGSRVRILFETGNATPEVFEGHVIKLLGDMSEAGRMSRVLISALDPIPSEPGRIPLLLGSYVRIDIEAGELENVLTLDRSMIREGNQLWLVNDQSELQVRNIEILWQQGDTLYVNNVMKPSEQLIVSGLNVALPGMKVQAEPVE